MKELKKFPEKGLTSSPNSAPFNRPNPKWHRAYEYKNPGMNDVDINWGFALLRKKLWFLISGNLTS